MENKDEPLDIEKLTEIFSAIQNLYYKKKEQLENLKLELSDLREILNNLSKMVSNKSFQSAEQIYSEALRKFEKDETEEFFKETIPKEIVKDTNIKRKIFSKNEQDLLCVLNFYDFNNVEIKFLNPEIRNIQETSENFIKIFLRGALIKVKENNPEMDLNYKYIEDSNIIEHIKINNLKTISEYDLITTKIRELLATELKSDS